MYMTALNSVSPVLEGICRTFFTALTFNCDSDYVAVERTAAHQVTGRIVGLPETEITVVADTDGVTVRRGNTQAHASYRDFPELTMLNLGVAITGATLFTQEERDDIEDAGDRHRL